jgi:hypothetical protein
MSVEEERKNEISMLRCMSHMSVCLGLGSTSAGMQIPLLAKLADVLCPEQKEMLDVMERLLGSQGLGGRSSPAWRGELEGPS